MAQIGIYLLAHQDEDPMMIACKLCGQYAATGKKVYGYSPESSVVSDFDEKLWTYRDGSFVSHEVFKGSEIELPLPAVLLGWERGPDSHRDVLLNLSTEIPGWYADFPRIVEVIGKGVEIRNACRARFKQYKAAGHEVKTFEQDAAAKSGWTLRS